MRILAGDIQSGADINTAMQKITEYADSDVICLQNVPDSLRTPILKLEDRIGRVIHSSPGVNSVISLKKTSVKVTYPLNSLVVMPSDDKKDAIKGTYLHFLSLTFKGYFYFIGNYEGLLNQQDPVLVKQSELLLTAFTGAKEKIIFLLNLHTSFKNIGMRILEQRLVNTIKAKGLGSDGMSILVSSDVIVKDLKRLNVSGAQFFFGDYR